MAIHLPVIDISIFITGGDDEAACKNVAMRLNEACRQYGAFHLTGHGIENKRVLKRINDFFSLTEDQKQSLSVSKEGIARGYIGMGKESGSDLLEVKEAFSYGYSWPDGERVFNELQSENVWPSEGYLSQEWRKEMEDFYSSMCRVADALARAFSISFQMPPDHLSSYCREGETISMMRLFHYYPYEAADREFRDKKDRIGSSPHTDWGFLTLILQQEDVSGLQLWNREEWHDIIPEPGALAVNCGDYFSLLTGGEFISPLHRVVSDGRERMSAVLFYYPSYDARIPLLGSQSYSLFHDQHEKGGIVEKNALGDMSFGEFIAEKWRQVRRK